VVLDKSCFCEYIAGIDMLCWFLLAGDGSEILKTEFISFFSAHNFPKGMALWKWKRTCWICSPESYKQDILTAFDNHRIIEFSSAPSASDIEFIYGDDKSLDPLL